MLDSSLDLAQALAELKATMELELQTAVQVALAEMAAAAAAAAQSQAQAKVSELKEQGNGLCRQAEYEAAAHAYAEALQLVFVAAAQPEPCAEEKRTGRVTCACEPSAGVIQVRVAHVHYKTFCPCMAAAIPAWIRFSACSSCRLTN